MKKRSVTLILSLIAVALLIAGCQNGGDSISSGKAFVGGTEGLSMNFVENEPPAIVSEGGEDFFDITLLLKNQGEFDLRPGDIIISLQGINRDAFSLPSLSQVNTFPLEGKDMVRGDIVVGEEEEIRYEGASFKYDLDADFQVDLTADTCYNYATAAVATLCLKRNPGERGSLDQCEVNNPSINVENSGAPVQITGLDQVSRGRNSVRITFDVAKTGSGIVFEPGTFREVCRITNDVYNKIDRVHIKLIPTTINTQISCSRFGGASEGTVDMLGGTKTIICTIDTTNLQDAAFNERLRMFLDYQIHDSVSTSFVVEELDVGPEFAF